MSALLEFRGVSKMFGSTRALDGVDFDLQPGEIHALLGENGAGKSTALGLVYGVIAPDEGEIRIGGEPVSFRDPAVARRAGIGCVFQELSLAGGMSVAENIYAGHPPTRMGLIDRRTLHENARAILASLKVHLDVTAPVSRLPVSLQQIVEIAKALTSGSRILLLDEPTSALAPSEIGALRDLLRELKGRGIGMIYVSHHIPEVFEIADRITVLRDGRRISTYERAATSQRQVIADMVGKQPSARQQRAQTAGADVFVASDLRAGSRGKALNLTLRGGEITALAGLMGSGAQDVALAIAGLSRVRSGSLQIDGRAVRAGDFDAARRAGLWFVPEERKADGLFLDFSVMANLTAATLGRFTRHGMVRDRAQREAAGTAIARFGIRTPSPDTRMGKLSGGNQQKAMLSRWLDASPRVLIVNEPTKGVDIRAKAQIHDLLAECAAGGAAVLVVSSDFPEVLGIANRVLIVRDGGIAGEVALPVTVDELVAAAAGETQRVEAA